jgi:hypothetical protein
MVYGFDPIRTRRMFMLKFAVAWMAAIVISAVPLWIAYKAGAF